ncbi:MAG TPA: fluoride efflux transporter CrcB [Bacteroidales bacterium]|nr:fluoride efflux transporter CrcB [Bacteroidales bacterium]HPR57988.1 fluoride efflux transporter CrcB [Bacteroidales bacterium]HRW96627.1 fluoride efflux transporter CrcB [Bacteroidales bacterium]
MFKSVIIAGIGGFIGTALRFVISRYFQLHYLSVFPWSTFLINILGSFLIGIFFGLSEKGNILSSEWRIFLTVGICGGFTTFSSLSNDAFLLMQNREIFRLFIYAGLSFVLGLAAVFTGRLIIKFI